MKIFVITDARYPTSDAVTTRMTLVCKTFVDNGHSVKVFSRTELADGEHEGIPYCSIRGNKSGKIGKIYDYFFTFSKKFLDTVKSEKPDAIVFDSIPTSLLKKLIKMKAKYGYDLIIDCVEWFSKNQVTPSITSRIQYYTRDKWMRKILPGKVRVIAISTFLKDYFDSQNTDCVYFPSVCDTKKVILNKNTDKNKLTVAYAGSPGRKDLFAPVVKAIEKLSAEEKAKLNLEIIGSTPEKIAENAECTVEKLNKLGDCIKFLPRMSHEDVLSHLEQADFTILIRPDMARYAKAGFPTKVPESLSTGTPVICNLTSDLGMFLTDGENAIVSNGFDEDSVLAALKKALSLTDEQRQQMYINSRKTAEESFDYRNYKESIGNFLTR